MSEELTNLTPEVIETPAAEVIETPLIDETGLDPVLDAEGNPIEPIEETEEVEWQDGKKYVVPKVLKSALMKDADYTQKTQAVAEQRRQLEAQAQQLQKQHEFQTQNRRDYARLESLNDQIANYEKVNWASAMQDDPTNTQAAYMQYQQLKDSRTNLTNELGQRERDAAFQAQQNLAKQLEQASAVLQRDIAGWSPQKAQELNQFAQDTLGFTAQELSQVNDARLVKLLNLAHLGQQLTQKAKQSAPAPASQPKPVTSVSGAKSPVTTRDEARMSDAEWREHRNKSRKR